MLRIQCNGIETKAIMQKNTINTLKTVIFTGFVLHSSLSYATHTNLKIMAVGDSITEGTKGESSYRQSLNNLLVGDNCDFDWVGSQTQVHGHNNGNVYTQPHEGYSGHTADDLLNGGTRNGHVQTGINDMLAHNPPPGVVLLHAGSNDISLGQSTASTVGDIEDLVAVIAADPNRLVFVANVIPWYIDSNGNGVNDNEWADINALTNAINTSNQSSASGKLGSYPNVILVDVRDPVYGYDYTDMHVDSNGNYEGIHPGPSGEDKIAQAFFDAMKSVDACEPPSTTIATPAPGAPTPATVTFTGSATDAGINGIAKVRVALREDATGKWYDFNQQQFESPPPVNESDANMTNTSTNYTDWNITATLPDGDYTFLALAVDNSGNEDYSGGGLWPVQRQFTVDSATPGATVYISPSNPANVGFNFYDEDIIVHDGSGWSMYFDGSDVGLGGPPDLNAFHIMDNGDLLLSFDTPVNLGGTLYDDSDIVRFTPTSTGTVTSGSFSMYLDGSTEGFTNIGEDIDAITENSAGELIVSTLGSAQIPRPPFSDLTQQDDDLARKRNSDGLWLRYFDGSDVGFTFATEDIWGASINKSTGIVYLTTLDNFTANGLSGDGNDIFTCIPGTLGNNTSCPLTLFWDGDNYGLSGERIDALFVE